MMATNPSNPYELKEKSLLKCPIKLSSSKKKTWKQREVSLVALESNPRLYKNYHSLPRRFLRLIKRVCSFAIHSLNTVSLAYEPWTLKRMETLLSLDRRRQHYKDACWMRTLFKDLFLITDPNITRKILIRQRNEDHEDGLLKGGHAFDAVAKIIGNENVITCPASEHPKMRATLQPFFSLEKTKSYFQDVRKQSLAFISSYLEKDLKRMNVSKEMPAFTSEAISRNILGFTDNHQKISQAVETVSNITIKAIRFAPSQHLKKEFDNAIEIVEQATQKALKDSVAYNLIKATKEENLPDKQIWSIVTNIFFGGQETTACTLIYAIYLLGNNPLWQEKIYAEWIDYQKKGESLEGYIFKPRTLLYKFLKETLRLNPPAYGQTREALKDLLIDDEHIIPKGTLLTPIHYFSQRDASRWGKNPHDFNPDRDCEEDYPQEQGCWLPFSVGPNRCIGQNFAMLEMKVLIFTLIETIRWKNKNPTLNQIAGFMLRTDKDVWISIEKRKA